MGWRLTQERLHLRRPHLPWMPLAMKKDEPTNPLHIGVLGAQAVVLGSDPIPYLIEPFAGRLGGLVGHSSGGV